MENEETYKKQTLENRVTMPMTQIRQHSSCRSYMLLSSAKYQLAILIGGREREILIYGKCVKEEKDA